MRVVVGEGARPKGLWCAKVVEELWARVLGGGTEEVRFG